MAESTAEDALTADTCDSSRCVSERFCVRCLAHTAHISRADALRVFTCESCGNVADLDEIECRRAETVARAGIGTGRYGGGSRGWSH